tara:strand:+ start:145 stop:993 length:849 start_codon:yes stop_codon:yes gene_type:complete
MRFAISLFFLIYLKIFSCQSILDYEYKLIKKLEQVHFEKEYSKSMELNEEFKAILKEAISNKEAFNFPFDSLSNFMSTVKSPDEKFRIFNWNIQLEDQKQYYECWILLDDFTIIKLKDYNHTIPELEYASLDESTWLGALYYTIIPCQRKNKKIYTLLGWDGNDMFSNKKIIESMSINKKNKVNFGISIFNYPSGKTKNRVVFQYNKQSYMSLKYNHIRKEDYIVFDHLIPSSPHLKDFPDWYVTDLSFDAFKWEENQWNYKKDFDAKSLKILRRPFNDPNK